MIPDEDAPENQEPELEIANAADPTQIAERQKAQRRTKGEAAEFWASVFASKVGRREMWRLLNEELHAFNTTFACGPNGFPQPEATFHALGQQQAGLRMYHDWLMNEPEGVRQMHVENDPRWAKPKRARNKQNDG